MTPKQTRFIDEYLQDFNATRAAIRAGYSEKTAYAIGWENLRKPEIAAEIDRRVEAMAMGRHERLLTMAEIARNEFVKTGDRLRAIENLGKLSGDYVDKHEHSGPGGAPLFVMVKEDYDAI